MKRIFKDFLKAVSRVIFRSAIGRLLISHLISGYVRLVLLSSRIERTISPSSMPYYLGEKEAIFTFWHGRMLLMPSFRPSQRAIRVMISVHRDGEWIAGAMARFGVGLVRGSSSRGGSNALREARQVLLEGENIVITPDGPRGPAEIAQQGAIALSSMTGVPVLPVSLAASRCYYFSSWDRFAIPLPFGRVQLVLGEPIFVAENASDDVIKQGSEQLTQALRQAGHSADRGVAA